MRLTKREMEIMAIIEQMMGRKIGTRRERIAGYKGRTRGQLIVLRHDIQTTLSRMTNLDNADEEELFRIKILEENLQIISDILDGAL